MKKISLFAIGAVLVALIAVFVVQKFFTKGEASDSRAKVVVPKVDPENARSDETSGARTSDENRNSFITLSNDETLIDSILMDFDGDGQADQITAVKTPNSPFISIVIAIFEKDTATYLRKATIQTPISQVKTFSFTSMDVIGDHTNSLVYQGFSENGNSVLKILNAHLNRKKEFSIETIADFETEGTIYIQQLDRDESYELSQARAASFPIWVSGTEEKEGSNQYDQLQTIYKYDEREKKYVQSSQTRVSQSRLEQRALQKIQDGTVETFAAFLDGLWYKTESTSSSMRYMYFDFQNKEIVFLYEDSEEVYSWNNSTLRKNGIYLTTVNSSIENLQRRFNISLVSLDSINLRLQDDVRMLISESNIWDGIYKKMQISSTSGEVESPKVFLKTLESGKKWESVEGYEFFFTDGDFIIKTPTFIERGIFSPLEIAKTELLQFRTSKREPVMIEGENGNQLSDPNYKNSASILAGTYLAEYKLLEPARPAMRNQKARAAIYDKNTIVLTPVRTSPTGFFKIDGKEVVVKLVVD